MIRVTTVAGLGSGTESGFSVKGGKDASKMAEGCCFTHRLMGALKDPLRAKRTHSHAPVSLAWLRTLRTRTTAAGESSGDDVSL